MFARVTGWTSEAAPRAAAIEGADARALASFPKPPRGVRPPLLLRNPWWARPFEVFSRLFGMPGRARRRPERAARVRGAAPLRLHVRRRRPGARPRGGRLLAAQAHARAAPPHPGRDSSAAVFGVALRQRFQRRAPDPPALDQSRSRQPLVVLGVPLVGGVVFLTIGFALSAIEAWWRGELGDWLATDGGFVLVYFGFLGPLPEPGLGVRCARRRGRLRDRPRARQAGHAIGALKALGELVERSMQILINTLSFARVGAFALAHAGLSSAVVALARRGRRDARLPRRARARQRRDPGARGAGRLDPDHAPRAVRVLRALLPGGGPRVPAAPPAARCSHGEMNDAKKQVRTRPDAGRRGARASAPPPCVFWARPPRPRRPPRRRHSPATRPAGACSRPRSRRASPRSARVSPSASSAPPRSVRWPRSRSCSAAC